MAMAPQDTHQLKVGDSHSEHVVGAADEGSAKNVEVLDRHEEASSGVDEMVCESMDEEAGDHDLVVQGGSLAWKWGEDVEGNEVGSHSLMEDGMDRTAQAVEA